MASFLVVERNRCRKYSAPTAAGQSILVQGSDTKVRWSGSRGRWTLFDDLRQDQLGEWVRLEQERIRFRWLERALRGLPTVDIRDEMV